MACSATDETATSNLLFSPRLKDHCKRGRKIVRARIGEDPSEQCLLDMSKLLCSWPAATVLPVQDQAGHHSSSQAPVLPRALGEGDLIFKVMAPSRSAMHHQWPHNQEFMGGTSWTIGYFLRSDTKLGRWVWELDRIGGNNEGKNDQNSLYASIKYSKNKNI